MWKRSLSVLPGISVSLLPKLMCPLCWPAYAGVVSALGLGFLISAKYLLPLTVAFLATTEVALGFRASRRHGYGPLAAGLIASAAILIGKFYFDAMLAVYAGVGLLIAASVWNSWPRRTVASVPFSACISASEGSTKLANKENRYETQN